MDIAGVPITSPDRLLFPDARVTKLEMLRYYEAVGAWIARFRAALAQG